MLYDVSDLLFWWFRAPGSGLIFSFLYFKEKNWRGRGTSTNEQCCCLNCQCIAVICFFLRSLKLWCLLHFKSTVSCYLSVVKSTLHAENRPNQRIYGGAEEQRCHVSTTNGQVRQAHIRVQSSARKFGSTDNSHCQNGSFSEALLWNISKISGWIWLMKARILPKRVFEKPFLLFLLTDSVHYFQPNTFSVLYKPQRL